MTAVEGGFSFQFNERQLASLRKKLDKAYLVMPPLAEVLRTLGELTLQEARSHAPKTLASSFDPVRVTPLTATVRAAHPGVRAMEAGRKPLVAGGKFPPPAAFGYITSDREAQYAIARAVAVRGTKGRFFMKKAKTRAWRELPRILDLMADAIERRWSADI